VRRLSLPSLAFAIGIAGALAIFAGVPLLFVLRTSIAGLDELVDPGARSAFLNTIVVSSSVTVIAVPVGAILAWLIERTDLAPSDSVRRWATGLLALPLAVPPYLLAMSWALLGNGRNGLVNRWAPLVDLYGTDGIILVLSTSAYPFALLSIRAALERADPSLEEAARVSGAGPVEVLRRITMPLVLPSIASAAALVFVFATAAFGVPYLLGSVADPPVMVLTTRIYRHSSLGGADGLARSAALAVLLLATSVVIQWGLLAIGRRRSTVQVSGKAARPSLVRLGSARTASRCGVGAFFAFFVAIPLATIAFTSFSATFADPTDLTSSHWSNVLGRDETTGAFLRSIGLASAAGAAVAVIGFAIARVAAIGGRRLALLPIAASLPYAVPGTVLAIGLILAFALEWRVIVAERVTFALYLPGTLAMLMIAYAVKHLAFGVSTSRAALEQIHPSLEEAARVSGRGPLGATRDVILPLVAPSIAAAFLLVALPCLSELTMSVLLFGADTETAGTLLFELQSYADPPAASVVATLILIVAIGGDALVRRLRR
jgi:iron(III) transport system permease protein